jgi:hypothetical protein
MTKVELHLWRTVPSENLYFGRLSFWALNRSFAERFGAWTGQPEISAFGVDRSSELYEYRRRIDAQRVLDLRDATGWLRLPEPIRPKRLAPLMRVSSTAILRLAEAFSDVGLRWVIFYEGAFEGLIQAQAVYLGKGRLRPRRCTE